MAGAKAAVVATLATAIPTVTNKLEIMFDMQLASVRMLLPWTRANLNHTAQALIISTGKYDSMEGAAYLIVAAKPVLAIARKNSFNPPSNP